MGADQEGGFGRPFPDVEGAQRLLAVALAEVGKTAMLAWLDRQSTATGGWCDDATCTDRRCQAANPNGGGKGELELAGQR